MVNKCDYCKKYCHITPYGSCVFLTNKNITLCIECNHNRLKLEKIKYKYGMVNFLKKREMSITKFIKT